MQRLFYVLLKKLDYLNMTASKKNENSQPLKHFKFGVELELFTLDEKGAMSNSGSKLVKKIQNIFPDLGIKNECGENMLEMVSLPEIYIPALMKEVIGNLEKIVFLAKEEGLIIYPFGTYPGKFTPSINQGKGYILKQEFFGQQRFAIAARCIGLHCHYSLPWGTFDQGKKNIKQLSDSKNQQSLINIHNLFIAMDPALSTFTQSSPFYQGKYLGKDSRVIVYRGGGIFNYPQGLYANYEEFGGLQGYIMTGTDLLHTIKNRFLGWEKRLSKLGLNIKHLIKHGSILDTTWNPVKINAHGTTEQRGMDANLPSVIVAVALLIKFIAKDVQEKYLQIVPSDLGIKSPFIMEGNVIYIPPDSYVRTYLQPKAAIEGLDNDDVFNYCSALLKLAKNFIPADREFLFDPLKKMLNEKKTMSDKILDKAKELGVVREEGITDQKAAALALFFSGELYQDLVLTKQALEKITPL